jgi:uncharacterized protein
VNGFEQPAGLERGSAFAGEPQLRVAISGSSGTIGSALAHHLASRGHLVLRVVRRVPRQDDEVAWQPAEGRIDASALEELDAVVHLAGSSIAAGRWTAPRRRAIEASRVGPTALLAGALASLAAPPQTLIAASAVHYYGDRGELELDERSGAGSGFLASVATAWEAACEPARAAGMRVVNARFGIVLARRGGALRRLLPFFRLGLGGRLGSGRQWMSWIGLDDAVRAIHHALMADRLDGPLNVVSPTPVRNARFVRTLGHILRRPTVAALPAFALRLALGRLADEALLASTRVVPRALLETGFAFAEADLEAALRFELLGRRRSAPLTAAPTPSADRRVT